MNQKVVETIDKPVKRRSVLKGVGGIAVAQVLAGNMPAWAFPGEARNEQRSPEPSDGLETRCAEWVTKAEKLKPRLIETAQQPLRTVRAVADQTMYLRWRMEEDAPPSEIATKLYRKGDSFILDFGGHRAGHLRFRLVGEGRSIDSPSRLRVTFGEVPGDVAEPLYPYKGTLSSAWLPVEIITVDFLPQLVEMPRRYAFRYVKIEVMDTSPNYGVHFEQVEAIALTSAAHLPPALSPTTPAWIRQVDEISLATLRDCMQTTFEDGPRRDQRLWIGDLRLQARASYVTMPNHDLVKRCLYLFAGLPRVSDGFLPACVFEKPLPATTDTFILDYAALFASILVDYVHASGDMQTGRELWPVALRQIEILYRMVDGNHIFQVPQGSWAFIDWNTDLDRSAAMQGLMIYAGRQLCELAHMIGNESEVLAYPAMLDQMTKAAHQQFYRPDRKVCVSGPQNQVSWASQAWLILAGCLTVPEAKEALRTAVINDKRAVKPSTPYLYHHVVEAMVHCDMRSEALDLIRSYWGQMAQDGADTFWEAYDPRDSTFSPYGDVHINSFCHAWSCTPTYFFRAESLGA